MNYGGNLRNFWELIPPIRCDFPALYKSESCTCLCVQTVETIIEPYPRLDLNCSRTWEPEWAAGFHWYCLRICPWVFCLGWDQQLAVLCLSHTKECSGFGSGVTQVEEPWAEAPGEVSHSLCSLKASDSSCCCATSELALSRSEPLGWGKENISLTARVNVIFHSYLLLSDGSNHRVGRTNTLQYPGWKCSVHYHLLWMKCV